MTPAFEAWYLTWVASTSEKQDCLRDVIGGRNWFVHMNEGRLSFGDDLSFQAQVLGTEGFAAKTWLWGHANPRRLPPEVVQASRDLQAHGAQHGVSELAATEVPLDAMSGHEAAVVATGLLGGKAYYRCPYEGGAAYLMITDDSFPDIRKDPLLRLSTVFMQATLQFPMSNQRQAMEAYIDYLGLARQKDGNYTIVFLDGFPAGLAEFDDRNLMMEISANLRGGARNRYHVGQRVRAYMVRSPSEYASLATSEWLASVMEGVRTIWKPTSIDLEIVDTREITEREIDANAWAAICALPQKEWDRTPERLLALVGHDPDAFHVVCVSPQLPFNQMTFKTDSVILLRDGPAGDRQRPLARAFGMALGLPWSRDPQQLMSTGPGAGLSDRDIELARLYARLPRRRSRLKYPKAGGGDERLAG